MESKLKNKTPCSENRTRIQTTLYQSVDFISFAEAIRLKQGASYPYFTGYSRDVFSVSQGPRIEDWERRGRFSDAL